MHEITFNELPEAITQLRSDVSEIKRLLLEKVNIPQPTEVDRWFNIDELCEYLPDKPAKATIYGYVHSLLIPFHKTTKRLRFLKSEIDSWLKSGKRKTVAEIEAETDQYLVKTRRRDNTKKEKH